MFHIITVELWHTFGGDRTPMRIVTEIMWGQNSNWIVTDILLGGTELQLNCDSHLGGTELLRELWRTFYLYNTGFGLTTIMTDWQTRGRPSKTEEEKARDKLVRDEGKRVEKARRETIEKEVKLVIFVETPPFVFVRSLVFPFEY